MKKSLIALAALATVATAAQAQSSVTVYGVMDVGYASISNVAKGSSDFGGKVSTTDQGRLSGMQNGGSATSRLGFRGTEDLGSGLKANFNLEAEILSDTGSQASTQDALFARASWVGLSGNFGEIKLGRMNTESYDIGTAKLDPYKAGNFGGSIAVGSYGYARINNAVKYYTPKFNGFQVAVETGTRTDTLNTVTGSYDTTYAAGAGSWGEVAGKTAANRLTGISGKYEAGNLGVYAVYTTQKNSNGKKISDAENYGVTYNVEGVAQFFAGYTKLDTLALTDAENDAYRACSTSACTALAAAASVGAKTVKHSHVGFIAPVKGTNFTVSGIYQEIKTDTGTASTSFTPKVYSLRTDYYLSKRTSVYGIWARAEQDGGSSQGIANGGKVSQAGSMTTAPLAKSNQDGYMVGVRHNF